MRLLSTLLLTITLAGCAVFSRVTPPPPSFPLLAPSTLGESRSSQQILTVTFGEQVSVINSIVTVTPDHLQVIAVNAVGLRLFSIDYDGDEVTAEKSPGLPAQLDPKRVLGDIQLAFWPIKALREAARGSEWEVGQSTGGTRWLRLKDKVLEEVYYTGGDPWQSRLTLSNYQFGYTLKIDPQAAQAPTTTGEVRLPSVAPMTPITAAPPAAP